MPDKPYSRAELHQLAMQRLLSPAGAERNTPANPQRGAGPGTDNSQLNRYLQAGTGDCPNIDLPREEDFARPWKRPRGAGPGTDNSTELRGPTYPFAGSVNLPREAITDAQRAAAARQLPVRLARGAGPGTDNSIAQRYSGVQTNIFGEPADLASADTLRRESRDRVTKQLHDWNPGLDLSNINLPNQLTGAAVSEAERARLLNQQAQQLSGAAISESEANRLRQLPRRR